MVAPERRVRARGWAGTGACPYIDIAGPPRPGRRRLGALLGLLGLFTISACAPTPTAPPVPPPDRLVLERTSFAVLPGWAADRSAEALPALLRSCARIAGLADGDAVDVNAGDRSLAGTAGEWRAVCAEAKALGDADHAAARVFFERHFVPHRVMNNDRSTGLFTGYYEPELRGARQRGGPFQQPLHGRPAELVSVELGQFRRDWQGQRIAGRVEGGRFVPYSSRAEIEAGALDGRRLELLWVDDPIEAFFLHIQGSGRVRLEDGTLLRVGYAAANGHPYVAIGRELVERGAMPLEAVSMQSIRAWLAANPGEARTVMNKNPSYVFFRLLAGDGPLGSEGVALTPGRSLAVDRRFIPLGLPVWLDVPDPLDARARLTRLMIAQDTGGAIRGPVRGDVFWGHGPDAAERAGRMRVEGGYWLLLPRAAVERIPAG